jgi:hypothetical protein
MHDLRSLVCLSAGTALGLTGCFVDSISEKDPELPLASSFEVEATLSFPDDGEFPGSPDPQRLLLRLDDAADGSVVAVLAEGRFATSAAFARKGERLSLRESVQLSITPAGNGYSDARLTFDALDLVPVDNDGDGAADAVEGTGSGDFSQLMGDVEQLAAFTVQISGGLDEYAPYLSSGTEKIHVLDGLRVVANEPLQAIRTAEGVADGKAIPLEMLPAGAPYVTEFRSASILPFAAEVGVLFEDELRDLAGHEIEFGLERMETIADPGLFTEDGFEGALLAVSSGVEVVTGIGSLPALSGAQSVLVGESYGHLTMRVPLQEGDTHLRFEARVLHEAGEVPGCAQRRLRLGFPALDEIEEHLPVWNLGADQETGDERWVSAGPLATMEFALPEGAGSEVIFNIKPEHSNDRCPAAALLIDDLRAE